MDDSGALKALGVLLRDPALFQGDWWMTVLGRPIPLLWASYVGPWDIYLTIPFLAAVRDPALALRIRFALLAAAGPPLAFWAFRLGFGRRLPAFLAGLALATMPAMAAAAAGGFHFSLVMVPLAMACLGAAWAWLRGGGGAFLALVPALSVLGAATHPHFLAFLPAPALALWLERRRARRLLARPGARRWLAAGAVLAFLALLPILAANLRHGGVTVQFFAEHLERGYREGAPGWNSPRHADVGINLRLRRHQLLGELAGVIPARSFLPVFQRPELAGELGRGISPLIFYLIGCAWAAALWSSRRFIRARGEARGRPFGVLLGGLVAGMLLSPFSPGTLGEEHLLPLLPLVCALAALPAAWRPGRALAAALLLLCACANLAVLGRFRSLLQRHGAAAPASPQVLELRDRLLAERPARALVLCDRNLRDKLLLLTGARLKVAAAEGPFTAAAWEGALAAGDTVVSSVDACGPDAQARFEAVLRARGGASAPPILRRDGSAAFRIWLVPGAGRPAEAAGGGRGA